MAETDYHDTPGQNNRFYVFCSDRSRNGKTLLARLFCANLPITEPGGVSIFDTDHPDGNLAHYHPQIGHIVDFSKTLGRVQLFDTVMAKSSRYTVADVQDEHLRAFFKTVDDIGFDAAAEAADIHFVVYYMMDKGFSSLENALAIRDQIRFGQFYFLVNEAIGSPDLRAVGGEAQAILSTTRILRFPELSRPLVNLLEGRDFDLFGFVAGRPQNIDYEIKLELWNLLEFLYQQRTPDNTGVTHFL